MVKKAVKTTEPNSNAPTRRVIKLLPRHITHPQTFKPGVSGNPHGRAKDTPSIKELKKYTRTTLVELLNRLMQMPFNELVELIQEPTTPTIERAVAIALRNADFIEIDKIFDRCVGKVTQKIDVEGPGMENHNHLHLGEAAGKKLELGDRIKAIAHRLSQNSSR